MTRTTPPSTGGSSTPARPAEDDTTGPATPGAGTGERSVPAWLDPRHTTGALIVGTVTRTTSRILAPKLLALWELLRDRE
ncbi:hypothetical protein OG689_44050 [Kitasatospora sp. NBC_00240]|uniref:hypothetical protein n=1 Tax=Kitasatospora sp. NBC_00240 TaxID=2903567 RepID=UPI002252A092|nr:hypothetical protein [Kitasatospora sp. NBC_00240]MCX5216110.1 hypothetical protein [Kitasatospora sp. NBC_00240]